MRRQRGFVFELALLLIFVLGVWAVYAKFTEPPLTAEQKRWRELREFEVYVRTDPLTGCQYVERNRGVTPRLDEQGRPICRK